MKATLRSCTLEEKLSLFAAARSTSFGWRSWVTTTGFVFIAAAMLVSVTSRHIIRLDVSGQWLSLLLLMVVWTAISIPLFSRLRARFGATKLRRDAARGVVCVEHYDIAQVIEVEEFEDLGPAYFVRTRDGDVHFLMGQYLDEAVDTGAFPCKEFEIVRAPLSCVVLDLKCSGAPIRPEKKIGPFRAELVQRGKLPEDGHSLAVAWDEIERAYA